MKYTLPVVCTLAMGAAMPVSADISFSQKITVNGAGGMSMFNSEGNVLTQLARDKSRSESSMKMQSKFASMIAGSGRTTTITRLDKGLTWQLDMDKERYTEITFAETRKQLKDAQESLSKGGGGQLPVSDEGCQWSEAKVEIEHAKGSEDIAGIKTKKHTIRMQQSCTDPQSGNTCDITWLMDTWLAKKVPGQKEALAFQRDYAKALGLDETLSQLGSPAQGLLGMYANNWDEVLEEFQKMKGYPMKMAMQMGMGGEQCKTPSGQPISMDETWADASTAIYDSALNSMTDSVTSSIGSTVASSLGGGKAGAAAGRLVKSLGACSAASQSNPTRSPRLSPNLRPAPSRPLRATSRLRCFG